MQKPRTTVPQEVPRAFAELLRRMRDERDPRLGATLAVARSRRWRTNTLAGVLDMKPAACSKRIERARKTEGELPEVDVEIPYPEKLRTMMDGRYLPLERIEDLRRKAQISSTVNGAMPADHPNREVSERYTAELAELIEEGYTPYYLSAVLDVSHRAITSRLERHGFREPCPSVAGTPSGVYRKGKIGDPD